MENTRVTRSAVPGYDATVVQLADSQRFALRNPDRPREVFDVRTVVAFDSGAGPAHDRPYFRVWGTDLRAPARGEREMDHNFTDVGVLPPHVRAHLSQQPVDHAPEERLGPAKARRERRNRADRAQRARGLGLTPDELARLRTEHGVSGQPARPGRKPVAELDAERGRVLALNALRPRVRTR